MGAFRDLTGQVFGRLAVIKDAGRNKNNKALWLCQCSCGNKKIVLSERLCLSENTRSCGCLQKESKQARVHKLHAANVNPKAAFNRVKHNYISGARRRALSFELTDLELLNLLLNNCFYCGAFSSNSSKAQSGDVFLYNSIDRINSDLGYTTENCVSSCCTCNWMKGKLSVFSFLRQITAIFEHQMARVPA